MGLVVDTNVFIDAGRGRFPPPRLARREHHGVVHVAAITVAELLAGVALARSTSQQMTRAAFAEEIVARVPVLDFSREVARAYARSYAHALQARGRPARNVHDLQIAAAAIAYGHTALTNSRADFDNTPGLTIEPGFGS